MKDHLKRGGKMKDYLRRSVVWSVACASALVLALALTTAGTARAALSGPHVIEIEGGTTDVFGDTGNMAVGGLVEASGTTIKKLNITIASQDNFIGTASPTQSFICTLTNPADLVISGGAPTVSVTLTVSATGDTCFRTITPLVTFSNIGNALTFRGYIIGNKMALKSTGSTLKDPFADTVGNVALSGEIDPSSAGSNQATGQRLIEAGGGAVDRDDSGKPSGHMAMAGFIELNPLKKGVTTGTAKALDLTLDYQDPSFGDHLACHLTIPGDVSYTLVKGVGTLTFTVGSASECPLADNTGKKIVFALYVGGAKGRIVSTFSTLIDNDGATDIIGGVAVVGEFSTAGGF
jgi:hypothetical protein